MKTCPRCGAQVDDNFTVCSVCGAPVPAAAQNTTPGAAPNYAQNPSYNASPNYTQYPGQNPPQYGAAYQAGYPRQMAPADAPNVGFAILGFFIPIVGLILYLVWKDQTPLKAKSCGKGALIGVIVNGVLSVLTIIFSAVLPIILSEIR